MPKKSPRDLIDENSAKPEFTEHDDDNEQDIYEFEDIDNLPESGSGLYIYSHNELGRAIKREFRSTRKDILKSLYKEESWKPFATITDTLINELDKLGQQFSNFKEVIDLYMRHLYLFRLESPEVINLPPLLLSGPPGVGKTRFMSEIAKVMGTDFYSLDFSTVSSGFVLNGGNSSWSDSCPGFISESIRKSRYANPIIMLDELDKVSSDSRFDPIGPLYGLLESHTAKKYKDEYLDIPMNLTGVIWVATANDPSRIPTPIRSRMIEIEISPPSPEQSRNIVNAIYKELLNTHSWGKHFSDTLDDAIIDAFACYPPRLIKIQLEKALANAAYRSKAKDRPICIIPVDIIADVHKKDKHRGIGFLTNV